MERLTIKNGKGVAILKTPYRCDRCGEEIYRLTDQENGEPIERLAHYEDLEEQGKLLKLPCAVGDAVYYITGNDTHSRTPQYNRVEKSKVQGFYFDEKGVQIRLNNDWVGNHGTYGYFGKTIFLSKKEADAALEKWREQNEVN